MKYLFFLLLISFNSFGQSTVDRDSLITKMCETLKENSSLSDTSKLKMVMEKHLFSFLKYLNDSSKMNELEQIDIRFQRQCKEYSELVYRLNTQKGDWKIINAKPNTELKKEACLDFLKYKNYYYLSSNGDELIENSLHLKPFRSENLDDKVVSIGNITAGSNFVNVALDVSGINSVLINGTLREK